MKDNTELIKAILQIKDKETLVQIIELCASSLTIGTVQHMAKIENKSYNGIKNSNQYRKITIGDAKLAIKGLSKSNMPF